jgi:hypothetical protein
MTILDGHDVGRVSSQQELLSCHEISLRSASLVPWRCRHRRTEEMISPVDVHEGVPGIPGGLSLQDRASRRLMDLGFIDARMFANGRLRVAHGKFLGDAVLYSSVDVKISRRRSFALLNTHCKVHVSSEDNPSDHYLKTCDSNKRPISQIHNVAPTFIYVA